VVSSPHYRTCGEKNSKKIFFPLFVHLSPLSSTVLSSARTIFFPKKKETKSVKSEETREMFSHQGVGRRESTFSNTQVAEAPCTTFNSIVYYESIKREPKIRGIKKCRCDERLETKTKEFTRLPYTGLVLELAQVHLDAFTKWHRCTSMRHPLVLPPNTSDCSKN
jgi:hypothetical protein